MTVYETIAKLMKVYPDRKNFEFLNGIFCKIGLGWEWQNGELVNNTDWEDKEPIPPSQQFIIVAGANATDDSELIKKYKFSPVTQFSTLLNIPEDVKDDWLRAAKELAGYILGQTLNDNISVANRKKLINYGLMVDSTDQTDPTS